MKLEVLLVTASTASEELVEHISMLLLLSLSLLVTFESFFSLLIINLPFIRVRKNLIGIRNFLKLDFRCLWVILIFVRVKFDGLFFETLLDLFFCCTSIQPEKLVVVLLG